MADYTPTAWVDDDGSGTVGTALSATRLNNLEAGVEDAAENSKQRGLLTSRPAAAPANKNWLWTDSATGQLSYSDGSTWTDIGQPNDESVVTMDNDGSIPLSNAGTGVPTEAWGTAALQKIATKFTTGATGFKAHAVEVTLALTALLESAGANAITAEVWSTTGSGASERPNAAISGGWTATRLRRLDTSQITVAFTGGSSANGPTLAATTTYWLVLSVTTPLATAQILSQLGTAATANSLSRFNGTSWTTVTGTLSFSFKTGNPMASVRARNPYPDTVPNTIAGTEGFYGASVIAFSRGPGVIGVGSPAVRAFATRMGPAVSATAPTDVAVLARKASSTATADLFRAENENSVALHGVNKDGLVFTPAMLVSALPSNPVDGQECYYQSTAMATAGLVFHLRYRLGSASAYKWEVLGAPALIGVSTGFNDIASTGTAYNSMVFANGPVVTLPLAGDYELGMYASPWPVTPGAPIQDYILSIFNAAGGRITERRATLAYGERSAFSASEIRANGEAAGNLTIRVETPLTYALRVGDVNVGLSARPIRVG